MEKSCKDIEDMLVDYADRQLSPDEANEVAEHLAKCERCRRMLQSLQRSLELSGVIWADSLAEAEAIYIAIDGKLKPARRWRYAAVAAAVLLVATSSVVWRILVRPVKKEPTFAQIEQKITEAGNAARLLAATDLLAQYPDGKTMANRQYRYILETYPDTTAATAAKSRIE